MRFIQMWIMPAELGLTPGVEQKVFTEADRTDRLLRVISGDGGDAVLVHQDAHVFVSHLNPRASLAHPLGDGRGVYLYVIEGDVSVNGERMATGDAAEIRDEPGSRSRRRCAVRARSWSIVPRGRSSLSWAFDPSVRSASYAEGLVFRPIDVARPPADDGGGDPGTPLTRPGAPRASSGGVWLERSLAWPWVAGVPVLALLVLAASVPAALASVRRGGTSPRTRLDSPSRVAPSGSPVSLRPTDGNADPRGHGYSVPSQHVCGPHVCVHWVIVDVRRAAALRRRSQRGTRPGGADAPRLRDGLAGRDRADGLPRTRAGRDLAGSRSQRRAGRLPGGRGAHRA